MMFLRESCLTPHSESGFVKLGSLMVFLCPQNHLKCTANRVPQSSFVLTPVLNTLGKIKFDGTSCCVVWSPPCPVVKALKPSCLTRGSPDLKSSEHVSGSSVTLK